jgi:hypothetical protein
MVSFHFLCIFRQHSSSLFPEFNIIGTVSCYSAEIKNLTFLGVVVTNGQGSKLYISNVFTVISTGINLIDS